MDRFLSSVHVSRDANLMLFLLMLMSKGLELSPDVVFQKY